MSFFKSAMQTAHMLNKNLQNVQRAIDSSRDVIDESLEICRTSQNPETRISRMGVAVERLMALCKEYPEWPESKDWNKELRELLESYQPFMMNNLRELLVLEITKIKSLKSSKARHKRVVKFTERTIAYSQLPDCDSTWFLCQLFLLNKAYPKEGVEPVEDRPLPTPWPDTEISIPQNQFKKLFSELDIVLNIEQKNINANIETCTVEKNAEVYFKKLSWKTNTLIYIACLSVLSLFLFSEYEWANFKNIFFLSIIFTIAIIKTTNDERKKKTQKKAG